MINKVKVIAFDAYFIPPQLAARELHKTVAENISLYGYGIKPYSLSMIETVIRIAGEERSGKYVKKVIELAQEMLAKPIKLLDEAITHPDLETLTSIKEVLPMLKRN